MFTTTLCLHSPLRVTRFGGFGDNVSIMSRSRAFAGTSWTTVVILALIVCLIAGIQLALPRADTVGPVWLIPFIELIGIPIVLSLRAVAGRETQFVRIAMNLFLIFLVAASVTNALLLLLSLLQGSSASGVALLLAGLAVLIINVMSFGLVYWWLDGGGPGKRYEGTVERADFVFPQQGMESEAQWKPGLLDYLYTAYTNIIAFSPTDTMPLTHRVKILFAVQSSTALVTIVVTLSRAINLIPSG